MHDRTALLDFVRNATSFDPSSQLIPFRIGAHTVGWLENSFADELRRWPKVFDCQASAVSFCDGVGTPDERSAAMRPVLETLCGEGLITGWRNEEVSVVESSGSSVGFDATPLMFVERAASRRFGFTMFAAHVNGLVQRGRSRHMWIATRSAAKAIDPGKFDNLAAGRISRGERVEETALRELGEEAGVEPALAAAVTRQGALRCVRMVAEGLHQEVVFAHDIILPADIVPQNRDGEVQAFACLSFAEVHELLATPDLFTTDAALTIIHCFLRLGEYAHDPDLEHSIYQLLRADS